MSNRQGNYSLNTFNNVDGEKVFARIEQKDSEAPVVRYQSLAEETFDTWDYEKGGMGLDNPTCMDEVQAWKFAATMDDIILRKTYVNPNTKQTEANDYTVIYRIKNASKKQVANGLKKALRVLLAWMGMSILALV